MCGFPFPRGAGAGVGWDQREPRFVIGSLSLPFGKRGSNADFQKRFKRGAVRELESWFCLGSPYLANGYPGGTRIIMFRSPCLDYTSYEMRCLGELFRIKTRANGKRDHEKRSVPVFQRGVGWWCPYKVHAYGLRILML